MNVQEAIETIARATPAEHVTAVRRIFAAQKCWCGAHSCDMKRARALTECAENMAAVVRFSHLPEAKYEAETDRLHAEYDEVLDASGLTLTRIAAAREAEDALRKA